MKKILAMLLASSMVFAFAACGDVTETTTGAVNPTETTTAETTTGTTPATPAGPVTIAPSVEKETLGYLFYEKLVEVKTENPAANSEAIAQAIMESKLSLAIPMPMVMPTEVDGFHQGIGTDGATFGGYATGTVIAPMMMGTPFILYIFDLAEGTDVSAFVKNLEANANPSWNICTTAEMTAVGACGNTVIIAMCDKAIPARISGIADVKEPANLTANTETVWNTFKTVMAEQSANPEIIALDVADALVAAGVAGTSEGVMDVIKHDAFVYEIDSWNGATITDGDKIVYIFSLEMGQEVENWTSYYLATNEGADVVFGSYNETIIAMVNFG